MKMKSVMAGLYTAPPAQGPMTTDICGTTPDESTFDKKTSAYPANESTPSWMRAPPESFSPTMGAPTRLAISIILTIEKGSNYAIDEFISFLLAINREYTDLMAENINYNGNFTNLSFRHLFH